MKLHLHISTWLLFVFFCVPPCVYLFTTLSPCLLLGTGKTSTIVTLLSCLSGCGRTVLLCAPTNVAIREVASRFLPLLSQVGASHNWIGCLYFSLSYCSVCACVFPRVCLCLCVRVYVYVCEHAYLADCCKHVCAPKCIPCNNVAITLP